MIKNKLGQMKELYLEKYSLWTQLIGCIGLFGSFFVVIIEWTPVYNGEVDLFIPPIATTMFVVGCIICTINWSMDPI